MHYDDPLCLHNLHALDRPANTPRRAWAPCVYVCGLLALARSLISRSRCSSLGLLLLLVQLVLVVFARLALHLPATNGHETRLADPHTRVDGSSGAGRERATRTQAADVYCSRLCGRGQPQDPAEKEVWGAVLELDRDGQNECAGVSVCFYASEYYVTHPFSKSCCTLPAVDPRTRARTSAGSCSRAYTPSSTLCATCLRRRSVSS